MSMKSAIKCNCGQRIIAKDVMQTGYYLRLFGPSFVYVKFRCSRCKKLGEQFVKQEDWEDGILRDIPSEKTTDEKAKFEAMGPIDIHEAIQAHFKIDDLKSLMDEFVPQEESK
jgi:DNA-directed RNA polymerase subunit RPC12/RpoP